MHKIHGSLVKGPVRLFLVAVGLASWLIVLPNISTAPASSYSGSPAASPISVPSNGANVAGLPHIEPALRLSPFVPFAAMITASKTDQLLADVNMNGKADPGDTLMYTVTITNTGDADATNVMFSDTIDANTTLVMGSVTTSPIAVNDTYQTIGNVNISVAAGQGVLANDINPNGPANQLTITAFDATSTGGGTVSVNTTDGSFTYNPAAGYRGPTDTFTYTLGNGTGKTSIGTVTINISGMLWFVNSAAVTNGDGRLTTPFNCLVGTGCFDPAAADQTGDNIFLYSGNYTGGLTLLDTQRLIGQGASQSILTITGLAAPSGSNLLPSTGGTNPLITTAGGIAITLGQNNGLHGITVGNTGAAGTDVSGNGFGTLAVKDVTLNGSGQALNLTNGTIGSGSTFGTVESNGGSAAEGIKLSTVGGSFTITTTNIVNPTGTGIDVQNAPSGTNFSFGNAAVNKSSTTGTGVNLNNNMGTFSFTSLAVTTSSGTGVSATSSGTVNVGGGSISATGGPALFSNPTTLGMTFSTATSTNSATTGISLTSASGNLSIETTTITNATDTGILVQGLTSGASVSFGGTSITNPDGDTIGGTGVRLIDNVGDVAFGDLDITPETGQRAFHATSAIADSGTITTTSGTISATNAIAIEINRTSGTIPLMMEVDSVSANGGANGVLFNNTSGSFTVNGTGTTDGSGGTIQSISGRGASFTGSTNITLKNLNFTNANTSDGGTCTDLSTGGCNAAIYLSSVNTVTLNNINITGTTAQEGINGLTVSGFSLLNSTVTNCGNAIEEGCIKMREMTGTCAITNSDLAFPGADCVEIVNTSGSLTLNIDNSTFRDSQASSVGNTGIQLRNQGTASGVLNVTNSSFTRIRTVGLNVQAINTGSADVDVTNNAFDPDTGTMIGIDLDADNSANLVFNIQSNQKIYARNGPAVNVFGDTNAVIQGRINSNTDVKVLGNVGSNVGSGIRANINKDATAKIEIKNNVVNVGSDDAGIDLSGIGKTTANPGGGTNTMDATVTDNNITIGATSTYGIVILSATNASDTNAVCVNVANNAVTRNPSSLASFRARVPSATGFFRMQGFVTNAEATWNNNGNTPMSSGGSEVSFGGSGTFGSCTTQLPTNPGPNLLIEQAKETTSRRSGEGPPRTIGTTNAALWAFPGEAPRSDEVRKLSQPELLWIEQEAIRRWRLAGIGDEDLARLEAVTFQVSDLPDHQLATGDSEVIRIDETAAGYGWYVDELPFEESEYDVLVPDKEVQTTDLSIANGKMDLLTVVMRQLGHVYLQARKGIPDNLWPLMEHTLAAGVRRLPLNQLRKLSLVNSISRITSESQPKKAIATSQLRASQAGGQPTPSVIESETPASPATDLLSGGYSSLLTHSMMRIDTRGTSSSLRANRGGRVAGFTPSGETVNLGPFTIPPGKSVTVMFNATINTPVTPAGTTQVCNQGTVTADGGINVPTDDPDVGGAADPTCTALAQADLEIVSKTDSPDVEVPAGDNITYTLNFRNNGPDSASNVKVTDPIPANTTLVSVGALPAGWSRTDAVAPGGTGTITFEKATVANAETAAFTIVVQVGAATPATTIISNTASTTSDTPDGTQANNSKTATTTVTALADLSITKTDGVTSVVPGTSTTYTIVVTNNGPNSVTGASVADTFPASLTGVTFTSIASGGATGNTGSGMGNINDTVNMPVDATITYTVTGTVNPAATGTLVNTATVTVPGGVTDPTPGNNSATDTDTLTPEADLSITKTDGVATEVPGTTATYTIVVTNNGPSNVTGASVGDTFPATLTGVTFTSVASGGATGNTASGSGNINDTVNMPAGSSITYSATGTIDPAATGSLVNTATVAAPGGVTDPTPGNNSATDTDTLTPQSDLAITKTDGVTSKVPGTTTTYTIVVSNNGPSSVTGATVADTFPATLSGVTYTSVAAGGATGNTASGSGNINDIVDMPAGSSITYTATGTIDAAATGSLVNTATVTTPGGVTDPTPGNNSATDTDTLTGESDLSVSKSDAPDPVTAGNNITYTINFTNNGPSDAQTVTVTDAVPANTTFVSASVTTGSGWSPSAPAVGGTGNVMFSKASVGTTETATFQIVVKVNSSAADGSTITNTATAASATTDSTPGNNSATATTTVQTQADVSVTKSDSPDPVIPGNNITYAINFTNSGPSNAQSVTVTDAVPVNTTFASASVTVGSGWSTIAPAVGGTGNVVFSKATVAVGETATIQIVVNVNANTPNNTTITNTVTAATNTTDPVPGNNSATATTTAVSEADLAVTKSDSPDPVCVGGNITYTINLSNNGPGAGLSTIVTDVVPANTTFVSAMVTSGMGWSISGPSVGGTGNVEFSKASVANGETATFVIVVKVNNGTLSGTTITNTVTAASSVSDPTPGNNSAMSTTTVDPIAPTITCPANVIVTAPTPGATSVIVNYPAPATEDNCGVASVVCTPPSGSAFPVGMSTVNCTATDTAGNTASCTFVVSVFDVGVADDSGRGSIFVNTKTGDYILCCGGMTITGRGVITKSGCIIALTHYAPDRRLVLRYDTCQHSASCTLQMPPGTNKCTIVDRNTKDDVLVPCPVP
jgi:uncharacterized repeat protein (TIGR01451 family)